MNFENEKDKFEFWNDCSNDVGEFSNINEFHFRPDNDEFHVNSSVSGQEQPNVNSNNNATSSRPTPGADIVERSTRVRKRPRYLNDYVR